jgi:hypothetical protein
MIINAFYLYNVARSFFKNTHRPCFDLAGTAPCTFIPCKIFRIAASSSSELHDIASRMSILTAYPSASSKARMLFCRCLSPTPLFCKSASARSSSLYLRASSLWLAEDARCNIVCAAFAKSGQVSMWFVRDRRLGGQEAGGTGGQGDSGGDGGRNMRGE